MESERPSAASVAVVLRESVREEIVRILKGRGGEVIRHYKALMAARKIVDYEEKVLNVVPSLHDSGGAQ